MNKNYRILEHDPISEVKVLVNEYRFLIGFKPISIKIFMYSSGKYHFVNSHFYKGFDKAGINASSATNFQTEQEALIYARKELLLSYENGEGRGEWILNENY